MDGVSAGAAAESTAVEGEEADAAAAGDEDPANAVPSWPKYENLGFSASGTLPVSQPDVPFPPAVVGAA